MHHTTEQAVSNTLGDDGHGLDADSPSEVPARGWRDVAIRMKDAIRDDHSSLSAAGVAFFGFLALVPGLAAMVSLYGLFSDPEQVKSRAEELFGALPTDARQLLTDQLTRITENSSTSLGLGLLVGLALALWAASSGVAHLVEAINVSYNETEERGPVVRRAMALTLTLLILVSAGVTIAVATALSGLADGSDALRASTTVATFLVAAAAFVLILSVLYRHSPDRDRPKWRWVSPGALFALVGWVVISILFRLYVDNFGSYNETYGTLAAIVIILFWLYLSAFVVLIGAQLNSELEHQTARDSTTGPDRPLGDRDAEMADTVGPRV